MKTKTSTKATEIKTTSATEAKVPKAKKPGNLCLCGCGQTTLSHKSSFMPGHDHAALSRAMKLHFPGGTAEFLRAYPLDNVNGVSVGPTKEEVEVLEKALTKAAKAPKAEPKSVRPAAKMKAAKKAPKAAPKSKRGRRAA